jgi:2,5-furandicarboxylate decarboxylase 1
MTFRTFIERIESSGHLVKIAKPVDAVYEIATIAKLLKGKPILFERVKGHKMPVVSNLCATRESVCLGLGIEKPQLIHRLADAIDRPRTPEVVEATGYREFEPDLGRLPVLTYYRSDGGPYIASGIVVASDPQYGMNASYHRAMVRGKDQLVFRVLERHLHAYMKRGLREFTFCIGNSMPVMLAGAISVEIGKSELAIANALADCPLIEIAGHLVPQSEIIIVCEWTGDLADEGPFVDLTETLDIVRKQPAARVKRIFMRENPVFHAIVPGDLEHKTLMGMPREPTIFREVSKECECVDVRVTQGGCSWLHAAVQIRKRHDDDGKRAIEAAFRGHASMKHVFVVDADIDLDDPLQIEWAMATRFQADRGMVVKAREKGSSLDPSSDLETKETTKVGFDLTIPSLARSHEFTKVKPPLNVDLNDYL